MAMTNEEAAKTLNPFVQEYVDKLNAGKYKDLEDYYHPNASMIETDKSCLWGKKDISNSLLQMSTECGETTMTVSNGNYQGVGDYIIFETDFCFHTEKAGDLKGHYIQIWKAHEGKWVIYHDEYCMV